MSSPRFPEPPPAITPTTNEELDRRLERLSKRKSDWLKVGIIERIGYLKKCLAGVHAVAAAWVADGCKLKGIAPGDVLAGEEWLAGPVTTARNLRLLIGALEAAGQPTPPAVTARPDGQKVAKVFPTSLQDKLMFGGFSAEVWIEPGKPASQGAIYREAPHGKGEVALILGAGNVSSIPPMDLVYKLFVENQVCILKMNPVNAYAGPHLEKAFKSLIDDGYLAIVYGGAPVGAYLANHAQVDTLHVTGSDKTYDAIVWGTDAADAARRKAANDPLNKRPFTAELGCVTPVLIVPGPWTDADIDFQARHVAGMVAQNASFNCNAAKVLLLPKNWPQRDRFRARVRAALARTPARKAYYPGAQDRYQGFISHYPKAETVGEKLDGAVPWTVIPDVPAKDGEYALNTEAFCGVLAEVDIDASDARDYLTKAVDFANDKCWGTLSTCVLVDPTTAKQNADALDAAVAKLRYGGIGVNVWPGIIYGLVSPTWGAFPGHPPTDIRSGAGVVHNTFMFDHPQKSVVRAPFRIKPTPVWFPDNKNLAKVGEKLMDMEVSPGWMKMVGVVGAALKG